MVEFGSVCPTCRRAVQASNGAYYLVVICLIILVVLLGIVYLRLLLEKEAKQTCLLIQKAKEQEQDQ